MRGRVGVCVRACGCGRVRPCVRDLFPATLTPPPPPPPPPHPRASCDACPAGYETLIAQGAITCTPCGPGYVNDVSGWSMLARTNVTVDTLGTYAAYYTTPAITNFTCQACPVRGGGDEGGARGGGVACWAALARRMPSLRPSPHPSPHLPTPRAQPNTYAPTTALSSCSLCAAGSSTVAEGAAICIPCGPGSYSPTPAVTCMLAPAGYYVNITGGVGGWGGWLGEWVGKGGGCARVGASRSARLGQASPLLTLTHPPLHSRAPPPCAGATSYAACTPGSYAGSPLLTPPPTPLPHLPRPAPPVRRRHLLRRMHPGVLRRLPRLRLVRQVLGRVVCRSDGL